ncbi:hypothetical protein EIN_249310 [Entamoeba invadens IP1]|uniref:Uncharacterized protein n=1 Tax=Entamoeba invadens IP1 TaxID=370355 RepID=A0A0A1UH88_ENTIV|nr:hypothetical protein EIN_249310 [Entamoeba invadens IP1]ELP94897.1 hypothetical protein EIN_249310 [Entamoeba invadens IP1]|eukprot:XP_004261668.1 hypothetical protein EIN_249310 [Entamoeba invadens IP1]
MSVATLNVEQSELMSAVTLVREAVQLKALQDSLKYNFLVKQLATPFSQKVLIWVQALTQCTTLIQPCHDELVKTIYTLVLPPNQQVYETYCTLLLHLVTSNTIYTHGIVTALFSRILPQNVEVFPIITKAIETLITLVPLSTRIIPQIFTDMIPNRWRQVPEFTTYISFFLTSVPQIPEVARLALIATIERTVLFDSELQKSNDLFAMEENDTSVMLASLIKFVLGWIRDIPQSLEGAFYEAFDNYIVRTKYLTHTPVLYFIYNSTEERANLFAGFLSARSSTEGISELYRALFICHLGGFVSNSALVNSVVTLEMMNRIGRIFERENNVMLKILLCQQFVRIFNRKHEELLVGTNVAQLFGNGQIVRKMIVDKSNPIGNCSQKTMRMFVQICKEKGLVDIEQVLAENVLAEEPVFVSCPLCTYDPYDLPSEFRGLAGELVSKNEEVIEEVKMKNDSVTNNSWDFSL